jgi:serine protease
VAGTAALIVASRVLGTNPSADAISQRLKATARHLGKAGYNEDYGYGLIDAAAATDPSIPVTPVPLPTPSH